MSESTQTAFVICQNLVKIYKVAELEVVALQGLDIEIQKGELLAIVGSSGSGKSTLMNILGGLDRPTAGKVSVGGVDLLKLSETDLTRYRRTAVGFVWQQTARNLIPYLSAQQNVELPMLLSGASKRAASEWAAELLEAVGLGDRRRHRLAQLSGGQQQRVGIALALSNRPQLLLADEPTGEVDSTTARAIWETIRRLNRQLDLTTVIVTHDPNIAREVDRVVSIRDGKLSTETVRQGPASQDAAAISIGPGAGPSLSGFSDQVAPVARDDRGAESTYQEYVVLDKAGRLQIPRDLREECGIGARAVVERFEDGVLIRPVEGHRTVSVTDEVAGATVSLYGSDDAPPERPQPRLFRSVFAVAARLRGGQGR
jgi:ABC-type lipoprotein export system ATPase subunit/bifunctional DNA-binding transcriptional regulator/antitoxin component of YhaV-PrlF toxin-antitoxin module